MRLDIEVKDMYIYNAKIGKMEERHYKKSKVRDFINDVRLKITMRSILKRVYREEKAI